MGQLKEHQFSAVIVVMGVSGCGKSTIAQQLATQLGTVFLEADDLHPANNIRKMSSGIALTDKDRAPWLNEVRNKARSITQSDQGCVIACSALKKTYREHLRQAHEPTFFVFLEGSRELILVRMQQRSNHFMPPQLLDSQFAALENPSAEAGVVTVTIDGSAADITDSAIQQLTTLPNFA